MTKKFNRLLFIYSSILGSLAMAAMIAYCVHAGGRNVEDVSGTQATVMVEDNSKNVVELDAIYEKDQTNSEYLCIPLGGDTKENQISLENNLMKQTLIINIEKLKPDYFYEHKLSGNIEKVQEIAYDSNSKNTSLIIKYKDMLEYESTFENGCLYIGFITPREKYDKILVIDPAYGGDENGICVENLVEKDLTLDITLRLKKLLDGTDIKVYYTRLSDENKTKEQIIQLVNGTKADMFLSIQGAWDETDSNMYGITTYYNETFFIPDFSSSDFAYLVEENVTKSASANALGLVAGEEHMYLVKSARVPVALIEVGYLSNKQERIQLSKEDYKDKIAKGLYEAILASYEELGMEVEK